MLDRRHYGARCDLCGWDTGGKFRSKAEARRAESAHVATCPSRAALAHLMEDEP